MGIVVTVFMLLGLLLMSPFSFITLKKYDSRKAFIYFIGFGLLSAGLWNFFWFGLCHPFIFWGQAALISGFFMVSVACIILGDDCNGDFNALNFFRPRYRILKPFKRLLVMGLFFCFLLYAVTLVRLNLGYPIID